MDNPVVLALLLGSLHLAPAASAQQSADSRTSPAAHAATETPDRASIDAVLKPYEAAYDHQSVDELLAVWPSLQNDKKGLKKIKDEFGRADISEMSVSLQMQAVQTASDGGTLVRCVRSETALRVLPNDQKVGRPPSGRPKSVR